MEINPITIRTLSMLGQRGVFGLALMDVAETDRNIVALSADLCNTSGLDRFRAKYPDRFFNVGIAEQNMVGVAAGLAAAGYVPFATTFANFAALRSCEQVRHFLGYMNENVKLVGFGAGFSFGMFGTTHYALEDVAALRAINNLVILSPADGLEVLKATHAAAKINAPVYLRLSGVMNNPIIYKSDYVFEIGKAITLREGMDVSIISTGSMVDSALKAAALLETDGISAEVVNMHTIKPLDVYAVEKACAKKLIVTVEEHSKIGGLGSAVAEVLTSNTRRPIQIILGTRNGYLHAGDFQYMLESHGLTSLQIAKEISNTYEEVVK